LEIAFHLVLACIRHQARDKGDDDFTSAAFERTSLKQPANSPQISNNGNLALQVTIGFRDQTANYHRHALRQAGHNIWYDEFSLTVGDSLRKSIDKGLANSQFGIVVLSPAFFDKQWTEYELNGLVAKEIEGGKVILPIWHKVSKDQVLQFSPTLADKLALNTAMFTIQELASKLSEALESA